MKKFTENDFNEFMLIVNYNSKTLKNIKKSFKVKNK